MKTMRRYELRDRPRAFIAHVDYTALHRYVRLATERDLGPLDDWGDFIPPAPLRIR